MNPPARILLVDDDPALQKSLTRALGALGAEIRVCATVAGAIAALEDFQPELLLLDVALPDGTGLEVLEAIERATPRPVVIGMSGTADPAQTFDLARLGARVYLPKPIDPDALDDALARALEEPPSLGPALKDQVGRRDLHDVEEEVRRTLVDEALARNEGSKRGAARDLGISRQLLQHILRKR